MQERGRMSKNTFLEKIRNTSGMIEKKLSWKSSGARLLPIEVTENTMWLTFVKDNVKQVISIPVPHTSISGISIIQTESGVQRAVGSWMLEDKEISYWELMSWLFMDRVEKYINTSSKRIYLERLLRSFDWNAAPAVFRNFQRIIDDLINRLPLVGTDMQAWAMCNRIQILDQNWDSFTPQEKLEYQYEKNLKYFPWTSLGQSDSGMCNNTLLKVDIRKTVPFGLSHHNPRRNLFQTLGMRGEEPPTVMSTTEKLLSYDCINRTGWNLMTAFLDLPENFEDQIIVSKRLADKFIEEKRKFISYGNVIVEEGDEVYFLHPLSLEPDGTSIKFNIHADKAWVDSIEDTQINFNGSKTTVKSITIKYKRLFKDGFKLTNRHGNKGVIIMSETGVVHDPIRGEVPLDVIVSSKSVSKRKNFGQLMEALTTLLHGNREVVVKDNIVCHIDDIKEALHKKGYSKDGTCLISNPWGTFKAMCGWVHWGCIKTPEDQLWNRFDTRTINSRDVRTAGNKFSHIETRALITSLGPRNPVVKEIMSYRQGTNLVFDTIKVLDTMRGNEPKLPVVPWESLKHVDQSNGFFHELGELEGTVADPNLYSEGFYFTLPDYAYVIKNLGKGEFSEDFIPRNEATDGIILDKIMVPAFALRRYWKHQSGKYGLSDVSALVNNIIGAMNQLKDGGTHEQVGRAIYLYFHGLSKSLSGKTGLLSTMCMAVRYPWTVKGTAAVSEQLDPNEIEIHRTMAKDLKVTDGDFVLVERFPCLGFMSLRVQKVSVTDDPMCKYVIRVSGNSLASLALDFDGDVLYLMSFHTKEARDALEHEFNNPHPDRLEAFKYASDKKVPIAKEMSLDDYNMEIFPEIDAQTNADIVKGLTGIKRGTGTIIALCYNLMRITENNIGYNNPELSVAMEKLLDKVANSVFSMKHAGKSLEAECREAICTADVEKMVALDLDPVASAVLAEIILKKAKEIGFTAESLKEYFYKAEKEGRSSIVNMIVRRENKHWFSSRSFLHPVTMLNNLDTKPTDLTATMFYHAKKDLLEKQEKGLTAC